MFCVINKTRVVANFWRIVQSKGNSCQRKPIGVSKCVIQVGTLCNTNLTKQNGVLQKRLFHVTTSRRALPAVVIVVLRPLAKIAAILFGRSFRKWWSRQPPEKKEVLLQKMRRNRAALLASCGLATAGVMLYYLSHLEVDPITGRRRFIAFSSDQILQLAFIELEMQAELHKDHFLQPTHPAYKRVAAVANKLLLHNKDIKQLQHNNWTVTVVDEPLIANAFVLPTGHIFIFTGILNLCTNDDQLCVILAHEISHVLLSHMAEQMSSVHLMDLLVLVPLAFMWAILPDAAALLAQWLSTSFAKVLFQLPFSRALEAEADQVGLQLTAKACYDVREASAFWAKMTEANVEHEWLSTHPSNETRQLVLDALMPMAIQLRDTCKCPKLPLMDPRTLVMKIKSSSRKQSLCRE